jgi:hypothetical protein
VNSAACLNSSQSRHIDVKQYCVTVDHAQPHQVRGNVRKESLHVRRYSPMRDLMCFRYALDCRQTDTCT